LQAAVILLLGIGLLWGIVTVAVVWHLYQGQTEDVHTTCLIARHLYLTQLALAHHLHVTLPHMPPTCPP
jgi:hypothetical protein